MQNEILNIENKDRLPCNRRKSFVEKIHHLKRILKLTCKDLDRLNSEQFKKLLINNWIKDLNDSNNIIIKKFLINNLKYTQLENRRKTNSIFHQTRLNVLPLDKFLFKIKKTKNDQCVFCNNAESTIHFLEECKAYEKIWSKNNVNRKSIKVKLDNFLSADSPPAKKRKIVKLIEACIEVRKAKILNNKINHKQN